LTSSDSRSKRTWFTEGATVFQAIEPGNPWGYVCPLCVTLFPENEIEALSKEHAPPKSQRGREIALTCRQCNSISGHKLDVEILRYEHALDFPLGTLEQPVPIRYHLGESTFNAEVQTVAESILLFGIPKQNPKGYDDLWEAQMEAGRGEHLTQSIEFRERYNHRHAVIGWLRAAFIVAFATFGYRYALHHSLDRVRQQIADPDGDILPGQVTLLQPKSDKALRGIYLVDDPSWAGSLAVTMGRHTVFLPWREDAIYERLAEHRQDGPELRFSWQRWFAWPKRPMYALDRL
jgi:hypothetical protein